MEIGDTERVIIVEPIEDPFKTPAPAEPERAPETVPVEPEKVPA